MAMQKDESYQLIIQRFKDNREKCEQYDTFGNDNRKQLDIIIDVFENHRDEEWITKKWFSLSDERNQNYETAMAALECIHGGIPVEDMLYPEIE